MLVSIFVWNFIACHSFGKWYSWSSIVRGGMCDRIVHKCGIFPLPHYYSESSFFLHFVVLHSRVWVAWLKFERLTITTIKIAPYHFALFGEVRSQRPGYKRFIVDTHICILGDTLVHAQTESRMERMQTATSIGFRFFLSIVPLLYISHARLFWHDIHTTV